MRIGMAADHGGFELKEFIYGTLKTAGFDVADFGVYEFFARDDNQDFVAPLAVAVAKGEVDRGLAICGNGVDACVAANKVAGVRAALIADLCSAHQRVKDEGMNVMCLCGRGIGYALSLDLVQTFLSTNFRGSERFKRRLAKVAALDKR